jgi:hypothetical protein
VVDLAEHRVTGHPNVLQLDLAVIGRHVERPPVEGHGESGGVARHQERGDAGGRPRLPRRAGEHQVVGGAVDAGVPALRPVDHPVAAVADRGGLQPRRVRSVVGFGQPEGHGPPTGEHRLDPLGLLRLGPEPLHHDDLGEVPDDRRLVLQIVVQAETLVREVLPDDRHVEVGAVAAAEARGQSVAQPACGVGAAAHLVEQVLPGALRYATVLPIGAGVLAPVVEVLHVLGFQGLDLGVDERVHLGQQSGKVFWQSEIHVDSFQRFGFRSRTGFSSRSSTAC